MEKILIVSIRDEIGCWRFPLSLPLNSEWISSWSFLHIFNFPACVDGSWMTTVRRRLISTKGGVEIGFTGFVSQFSMVVEAIYGGAGSEGSWMDAWVLEFDFLIVREKRLASWRLSILFLPALHMHFLFFFLFIFLSRLFSKQLHTFQLNPLLQYSWR